MATLHDNLKTNMAAIVNKGYLFDKPMKCFAFLFAYCFYVYFLRSYECHCSGHPCYGQLTPVKTR